MYCTYGRSITAMTAISIIWGIYHTMRLNSEFCGQMLRLCRSTTSIVWLSAQATNIMVFSCVLAPSIDLPLTYFVFASLYRNSFWPLENNDDSWSLFWDMWRFSAAALTSPCVLNSFLLWSHLGIVPIPYFVYRYQKGVPGPNTLFLHVWRKSGFF